MPYGDEEGFAAHRKPGGRQDYAELATALQAEESAAIGYLESEIAASQIEALQRYFGEPYGDEVKGRSQVCTREIYELVEWLRADLRRVFTAGGRIVEVEGVTPESDRHADDASDYLGFVFFKDNDGSKLLDEFVFDGLLQRGGFIAADWKAAEYAPPRAVSGLNTMQAQALMQAPDVEIVEQDVRQEAPDEAHPDGLYYDFKVKQRTSAAKAEIFTVAPEDMRISARAVDLATCAYCGNIERMMKGEAKRLWPDFAEEIDSYEGRTNTAMTDERRATRFRDLTGVDLVDRRDGQGEAQEIEISREYIRYDLDEDGYPELLRAFRIGGTVLECEEVADHIYSTWSPNPIPHRFWGMGINDEARDLQRTKTVLLRSALDSVYQSVVPRMGADENAVNLDDLLTVEPGVAIRTKGNPADKLMPIPVPDLSGSAFKAMEFIDQVVEKRTGVTRHGQGMDPDALNKTATGVRLIQNAANVRKENIARNVADGLQDFFLKLYKLICAHQNEARAVKINGAWRNIDPRPWAADVRVTVNVGLGTGAREAQLAMISMLQADQVAWVQAFGPATPAVTPMHMWNLVREKGRIIGYKSVDQFFGEPKNEDGSPFVPKPPPDPNAQKAQAEMAENQARLQMDQQKAAAAVELEKMKSEALLAHEREKAALQLQLAREKQQADSEIEAAKAEADVMLQRRKMEAEAALAQQQQLFEMELAERRQAGELAIAEKKASMAKPNGHDPNFGGAVG